MSLKVLRQQLLSERAHDEIRRKWAVRLADKIIANVGDMIDWGVVENALYLYKSQQPFPLDFLRTKQNRLPLGPDGDPILNDDSHTVQLMFHPVWGNKTESTSGSLSFGDKGNDTIHHLITLTLKSGWIGLASNPDEELKLRQITKPPLNWQPKMFAGALLNAFQSNDRKKLVSFWARMNREVLIHELTHLLDRIEYFNSQRSGVEKSLRGYESAVDEKGSVRKDKFAHYFNHNVEYNAFYITALNWILEDFDRLGISEKVIKDYTQEEFVRACLSKLPDAHSNYKMLSDENKRRITQRLSRWYNDVLLPKYRARGKTSFSVKTKTVSPEIAAEKTRLKAEAALKAKRKAAAEKGKATKAKKYGKGDKVPPFIEYEHYGFNGWQKHKLAVPPDATIENGMLTFKIPGNMEVVHLDKTGEGFTTILGRAKKKTNASGLSGWLQKYADPVQELEAVWPSR